MELVVMEAAAEQEVEAEVLTLVRCNQEQGVQEVLVVLEEEVEAADCLGWLQVAQ